MAFNARRGTKAVALLVKSILRRNAHLILLVSLSASLFLTIVLYSLPSPALFLEKYSSSVLKDANVVIVSQKDISETCIKVRVVEAELAGYGSVALVYPEGIAKFSNVLKLNETGCRCNDLIISLPQNLHVSLNHACNVKLKIGNAYGDYCVGYVHESLEAVMIIADDVQGFQKSGSYLCLASKLEIARNALIELENSILNTADAWLFLLLIASLPGVYIASTRVLLSVKNELKVLLSTGLSETTITLYCAMALWILEAFSALFLLSLSTVVVYSAFTVLNTIAPVLMPAFRLTRILRLALLILVSMYFVSLIASWRFIKNDRLL